MSSFIQGTLQAVTIITNTWQASMRFYQEGLGYQLLLTGELTPIQKSAFGTHLGRFALLGYESGSVVRLIETSNQHAIPNRLGGHPWDNGMSVFEAGTPDIQRAYQKILRARFGATALPTEFDTEGPEPLGYVVMKSTAFIGPSGEQIFVTQIVRRKGGESLLKESAIDGINTPANVVLSMRNRLPIEEFWKPILGIEPVNDLVLRQENAARIMGGPDDMGFDMLLMGHDKERIGLEQHIYEPHHPDYTYHVYPCSFEKTGLACASWYSKDLDEVEKRISDRGFRIISKIGLPNRFQMEPKALIVVGMVGEMIELLEMPSSKK